MFRNKLLCLILIYISLNSGLNAEPGGYTAAVVDYYASSDSSQNFEHYSNIIENIKQGVDFIVFPESTLTTSGPIEVFTPNTTICDKTKKNLDGIACLAKEKQLYIIINISERVNCTKDDDNCPSRGYFIYNTNLVYGKDGSLVTKYRKWNLFGETNKNTPSSPDITTFETDKGTFGTFTCFDILFATPPLNLTRKGVKDIIYTNKWFSELPFLTALQTQQMWALETNVSFLSSGANYMGSGSGGTSIILNNRVVNSMSMAPDLSSTNYAKVLYSDEVDQEEDTDVIAKSLDKMQLRRDDFKGYNSILLPREAGVVKTQICHESFCCNAEVNQTVSGDEDNSYIYRLVVFSGVRNYPGISSGGLDVCGLVACTDDKDIKSCSDRFSNYKSVNWPITFNTIKITAEFPNVDTRIQFPNTLLSSLRPIRLDAIKWEKTINGTNVLRELTLIKPQNRLMTFAIFGRNFERDSPSFSRNGFYV